MPSHKSSAVAPQRARGRARVEALLEAAAEVFAERGYDHATMTEIAERSSTAIGSLYRFFPTKEALGESVLRRYAARVDESMAGLRRAAVGLDPEALADALVERMMSRDLARAGASAVLEAHGEGAALGRTLRAQIRAHIAGVLRAANPKLQREAAEARAAVIIYALKGLAQLRREEPRIAVKTTDEQRRLLRVYLADALSARRSAP